MSSAQIADVVSPKNRAAAFGILFACFSIGYCVSAGLAPLFSKVREYLNSRTQQHQASPLTEWLNCYWWRDVTISPMCFALRAGSSYCA